MKAKLTADPGRSALAGMAWLHALGVPLAAGALVWMVEAALQLMSEPQVIAWPAGWM